MIWVFLGRKKSSVYQDSTGKEHRGKVPRRAMGKEQKMSPSLGAGWGHQAGRGLEWGVIPQDKGSSEERRNQAPGPMEAKLMPVDSCLKVAEVLYYRGQFVEPYPKETT
jgi:hypothetical protein